MLMSFVVFEKSNLPTSLIATMALMLNVSAHVAELIRISIMATDKMQAEAAVISSQSADRPVFHISTWQWQPHPHHTTYLKMLSTVTMRTQGKTSPKRPETHIGKFID